MNASRVDDLGRPHITVLHSSPDPAGKTRFVVQLAEGAPPELTTLYFSWKVALRADYDIFHTHWPEYLLRGRTALGQLRQRLRFVRLLSRLQRHNIPIVRTLHNVAPHERGSAIERWLLRVFDRRTALFIRLNDASETPEPGRSVTILHGHYRDRFSQFDRAQVVPGRILNFGLIRPYKGIEALLAVFPQLEHPGVSLRIVGQPVDQQLSQMIKSVAEQDPRVTAELRFVDDAELVAEVTASELVILPYAEMHNSGTLLVALSLGKRVIAPWSPSNQSIADEIGGGWLFLYRGPLTTGFVDGVLSSPRGGPDSTGGPDLSRRDWDFIGSEHYRVYSILLSSVNRQPAKAHP